MSSPLESSGQSSFFTWDYEEGGGSWAPATPVQQAAPLLEQDIAPATPVQQAAPLLEQDIAPAPMSYFQMPVQSRTPVVYPTGDQTHVIPALPFTAGAAELKEQRARKAARRRETRQMDRQEAEQAKTEYHKALTRIAELEAENKAYKTRIAELEAERRADHARIAERDVAFNAAMNSIMDTAQAMRTYQNRRT